MHEVLTIGDITIDLYFKGKSLAMEKDRFTLAIGGKYVAEQFHEGLGGGAANVAIGLSNLGFNCAVAATVGENVFKQIALQKLINKRISSEFIIFERGYINISTILLSPKGERSIIHYPTPKQSFGFSPLQEANMQKCSTIYMGHTPGIDPDEKIRFLKLFRDSGKFIILNLGVDDARGNRTKALQLAGLADCLIVNKHEFSELIGKKGTLNLKKDVSFEVKYQNKLLVITDGADGSYAYHEGRVYFDKAPAVQSIEDATGAGDGYTAGFLASYLRNKNIQVAMEAGTEYAGKILKKIGAN